MNSLDIVAEVLQMRSLHNHREIRHAPHWLGLTHEEVSGIRYLLPHQRVWLANSAIDDRLPSFIQIAVVHIRDEHGVTIDEADIFRGRESVCEEHGQLLSGPAMVVVRVRRKIVVRHANPARDVLIIL